VLIGFNAAVYVAYFVFLLLYFFLEPAKEVSLSSSLLYIFLLSPCYLFTVIGR